MQVEEVYDPREASSGSLMLDECGNKLPPFIVMEKGESLIDWSKRNRSDVFQAVAVRFRRTFASSCKSAVTRSLAHHIFCLFHRTTMH